MKHGTLKKGAIMTVKELIDRIYSGNTVKVMSHWHTNVQYPTTNVLDRNVQAVYVKDDVITITI